MTRTDAPDRSASPAPSASCPADSVWLPRHHQPAIAAWLCLAACAIALSWIRGGGPSGQLIEIDQASPVDYQAWIDINRADWPELTLLPGVSETMARRIVDARAAQGPFESVDDLARLPGIGPKTLARLRPYAQAN